MPESFDRRAFFRSSLRRMARAAVESWDALQNDPSPPPPAPLRRIRPPGALAEGDFLARCTRCNDCVQACPAQCIIHVPEGHPDAGTPWIRPEERACVLCTGLQCTQVCEPGALRPLERPLDVRIGLAEVDRGRCVTWHGAECRVCVDVCPVEPAALVLDGAHPRVEAAFCTGCGLCEERCPVRPPAIRIQPLAGPGAGGAP